ncbi:MAG: arsenite methyltransferase [Haliangiales bacterium]
MNESTKDDIRALVRERYGRIARGDDAGCCAPGACGAQPDAGLALGYSRDELDAVPEGASLGLGCGNPQATAGLREGETVLDLGAGAGFDCLLAAQRVGPRGHVIGVDMTPEMVSRARANAAQLGASNVHFRLGEIENLPVPDDSVDVILSNCVVNLSPDKAAVFREAYRVLKAGGRLAIADVVATAALPAALPEDVGPLTSCVAGAVDAATLEQIIEDAGFVDVEVRVDEGSRALTRGWAAGSGLGDYIASAAIAATKPGAASCCGPTCCAPEALA